MRPVWMKIKGLTVFWKPRRWILNFLAIKGLFGILDPQGSGKSSILDGMTGSLLDNSQKQRKFYSCNRPRFCRLHFFGKREQVKNLSGFQKFPQRKGRDHTK